MRGARTATLLALVIVPSFSQSWVHLQVGPGVAGGGVDGGADLDGDGLADFLVSGIGLVQVFSGQTGLPVRVLPAPPGIFGWGARAAFVGDLDGDSVREVAVAVGGSASPPAVHVVSGATGATLFVITPPGFAQLFADSLADAGDLDGDGTGDIVVGAPGTSSSSGQVFAFSGVGGVPLWTAVGTSAGGPANLGTSVCGAGDVDGDGLADVLAGAGGPAGSFSNTGFARLLSGVSGATIRTYTGLPGLERFGRSVAGGADLDGDGVPDQVVGAPAVNPFVDPGRAVVYAGATGAQLAVFTRLNVQQYGSGVALADYDGDGTRDVVVSAPSLTAGVTPGLPVVEVYSGATGTLLGSVGGSAWPFTAVGASIASCGDTNGDGTDEVLFSGPGAASSGGATFPSVHGSISRPPVLGPAARGSVGALAGGPFPVLTVNGSTGGPTRRVDVPASAPITVAVGQPPTTPTPAGFALYAYLGTADARDATPLPLGIGTMAFPPCTLFPGNPLLFTVASSLFVGPCTALVPATAAPWTLNLPAGSTTPVRFVLQPVIEETPGTVRVGNAVLVDVP